jgi:iron(III) transport system ATP-binding protein
VKSVSVSLKNVHKVFKDFQGTDITAVNNVSFDVEPASFVTLLGPSGCGKTTTLRMIAGFETPTKGKILIGSEEVTTIPPWKRDIAMVFQSYGLFPHMSVGQNIAYGLKMRKVPKSEIEKRVRDILNLVGLHGFEDRPPSSLSGGQQQRVALARSIVIEPSVLLFDEPLSNLDVLLREQMRVEIRKIQQRVGITAIYVTHDRTEAMTLSDKIIVMNGGKIVQMGSPIELYERPNSKFVATFLGKVAFFPIRVLENEGEFVWIELEGKKLKVRNDVNIDATQNYVLACRPESMNIAEKNEGYLNGKVTATVFMGSYMEFYIATEYGEIMVKSDLPLNRIFKIGEEVSISFNEERVKLIPDN